MNLNKIPSNDVYLLSKDDESCIWHMRVAHIHMDHLNKLIIKDMVIGLPNLCFEKHGLFDACQKGKLV